jgi:hypothetical protein
VECYLRNGERLENGEWSYWTPRVFEEFQQKFLYFQGTYQLVQKIYKCVNMFLETGTLGSAQKRQCTTAQKEQLKILNRLNKELQRRQINQSGDKPKKLTYHLVQFSLSLKKNLHFFLCRVSVVHQMKPLDNKSPHNILNISIY